MNKDVLKTIVINFNASIARGEAHPTELLCKIIEKVYGHKVSTKALAKLIEESPLV